MANETKRDDRFVVQIRTERETKEKAVAIFKAMGMDLSTGINVYLKQVARDGGLPFTPSTLDPLEVSLADAISDVKVGRVDRYNSFAEYQAAMDRL
jgi:DNA-damage-inducible protein J